MYNKAERPSSSTRWEDQILSYRVEPAFSAVVVTEVRRWGTEKELAERRPLRRQAMDSFMIIVMCDGLCMLLLSWIFDGPVAVALHYLSTAVNEAEK
jgi:hypothetical protein